MGLDLVMRIDIPGSISDAEVHRASVLMCSAGGTVLNARPHGGGHGLEVTTRNGGVTSVGVASYWRFYGPGYERGPLVEILATARFARSIWPDASVWYGSDSGEELSLMTPDFENELWRHFTSKGGRSYFSGFGRHSDKPVACDHCRIDCNENMYGGDVTGHYCPSCGMHWTRNKKTGAIQETSSDYRSPREVRRPAEVTLPKLRIDAIVAQLHDGSDPRSALVDLAMLIDEVERANR